MQTRMLIEMLTWWVCWIAYTGGGVWYFFRSGTETLPLWFLLGYLVIFLPSSLWLTHKRKRAQAMETEQ